MKSAIFAGALVIAALATPAAAESCSTRASLCLGACTPALVGSGQQHGGTVEGCRKSCNERKASCLRSGVWVHMGARTRGQQEAVEKR